MARSSLARKAKPMPAVHPEIAHAYALQQAGRIGEAEQVYTTVLRRDPSDFYALHQLGLIFYERKDYSNALLLLANAVERRPDSADALSNLALALQALERNVEALACYDAAVACAPRHAQAHYNRGNVLIELGRHPEALAAYDRALALAPGHASARYGRGNALRELRRHDDALAEYERALALDPKRVDVRFNAALTRLRLGQLREGFRLYEARWGKPEFAGIRERFPTSPWSGDEPLAGKTVLLYPEQGLGDAIQFVRYAPLLTARGAAVVLEIQPALKPLIAGMTGVRVFAQGEALPPYDMHAPLMSLPHAFGTELDTVPADVPYLSAPADRVAAWRERLPRRAGLRVGLVWAGNPSHVDDRNRSIPLATLAPLLAEPNIEFVSLQRELRPCDAELLQAHPGIAQPAGDFADFADTAAVIDLLDLVVTVDTSVAHLAGAMGKPAWVLLPFSPDFRWLLDRDDSPWYPSARLFRQPKPREWQTVVARLRDALREKAAG